MTDLVVGGGQARHHEPENNQERAAGYKGRKVSFVKDRACQDTDNHNHETLNAAYPADGGCRGS